MAYEYHDEVEDRLEGQFAIAEEAEADRMELEGLRQCECGDVVEEEDMESVFFLHWENGKPSDPLVLSTKKHLVCKKCAPSCTLCDGLLDDATLWERGMRGPLAETQAGMSVEVNTPTGKMHGGCAAAEILGERDGEDLSLLGSAEIAAAYTRSMT